MMLDTPTWFAWLEHATTCVFRISSGHFTDRKCHNIQVEQPEAAAEAIVQTVAQLRQPWVKARAERYPQAT